MQTTVTVSADNRVSVVLNSPDLTLSKISHAISLINQYDLPPLDRPYVVMTLTPSGTGRVWYAATRTLARKIARTYRANGGQATVYDGRTPALPRI